MMCATPAVLLLGTLQCEVETMQRAGVELVARLLLLLDVTGRSQRLESHPVVLSKTYASHEHPYC